MAIDDEQRFSGFAPLLLAAAFVAVELTLVGPHTLYVANSTEYGASFRSLAGWLLGAAAVLTAGLFALQALAPRNLRGRACVFVFSLGVLAWVQANCFVGNFGLLDGDALDFAAEAGSRWRDVALWLAGIALAQVFAGSIRPHIAVAAGAFLVLQAALFVFANRSDPQGESAYRPSLEADDAIFEFSTGPNIVLVIVDTVTSDSFEKFADLAPARYDEVFSGFTLYSDTVGAFPSTQYSVPVMLGAEPYDNRVPIEDYMHASLGEASINSGLIEAGFEVDWVSAWPLFCVEGRHTNCFSIPRPYASPDDYRRQTAAELLDLSLFRHVPYDLKRAVYRGGSWVFQAALWREGGAPVFVSSAAAFLRDFDARARVARDAPTFKILHTAGGHGPFVLDADCSAIPSQPYTAANYERQLQCSIAQLEAILGRLHALGVYDRSLIVIAGDHGASFGAQPIGVHGLTDARLSRARPLLAVKWPGDSGGLRRSRAAVSIQDIAPTIAAVAGLESDLPGRDLATVSPDEARTRSYGIYVLRRGQPGGRLERLERYRVGADGRRAKSWWFDEVVFSPEVRLDARSIDAGTFESEAHFSYLGWGRVATAQDGTRFVPAIGAAATVFSAVPRDEPGELVLRARVQRWALPQTVAVDVDGAEVARLRIETAGFAEHRLEIPARGGAAGITQIRFRPANTRRAADTEGVGAFDLDWLRFLPD